MNRKQRRYSIMDGPTPLDVMNEAERQGVDPLLAVSIASNESAGDPNAVSRVGARSVMQVMPATGRRRAAELGERYDPNDPWQNVRLGVRELADLSEQFDSHDEIAAAYNAGAGAVRRHGGIPPFRETRNYVPRVRQTYQALERQLQGQQPEFLPSSDSADGEAQERATSPAQPAPSSRSLINLGPAQEFLAQQEMPRLLGRTPAASAQPQPDAFEQGVSNIGRAAAFSLDQWLNEQRQKPPLIPHPSSLIPQSRMPESELPEIKDVPPDVDATFGELRRDAQLSPGGLGNSGKAYSIKLPRGVPQTEETLKAGFASAWLKENTWAKPEAVQGVLNNNLLVLRDASPELWQAGFNRKTGGYDIPLTVGPEFGEIVKAYQTGGLDAARAVADQVRQRDQQRARDYASVQDAMASASKIGEQNAPGGGAMGGLKAAGMGVLGAGIDIAAGAAGLPRQISTLVQGQEYNPADEPQWLQDLRQMGALAGAAANKEAPGARPFDPSDLSTYADLPRRYAGAAGSTVPFMLGAAATGGGTAGLATVAAMGAGAQSASQYSDALAHGATPEQLRESALLGAALGTTEAIGGQAKAVAGGLKRGALREVLGEVKNEALEEAAQEGFTQFGGNVIAKDIVGYDPNRKRSEGVIESALVGGALGGFTGGVMGTAGQIVERAPDLRDRVFNLYDRVRNLPPDVRGQAAQAAPVTPEVQAQQRQIFQAIVQQHAAKLSELEQQAGPLMRIVQQGEQAAQRDAQMTAQGYVPVNGRAVQAGQAAQEQLGQLQLQAQAIIQQSEQQAAAIVEEIQTVQGLKAMHVAGLLGPGTVDGETLDLLDGLTQARDDAARRARQTPFDSETPTQPATPETVDLLKEVRKEGGIGADKDVKGELRRLGVKESKTTGIINQKTGLPVDEMRLRMRSEGFTQADTVDDFVQELDDAIARRVQRRHSRADDQWSEAAWNAHAERWVEDKDDYDKLQQALSSNDIAATLLQKVYEGRETDAERTRLYDYLVKHAGEAAANGFFVDLGRAGVSRRNLADAQARTDQPTRGERSPATEARTEPSAYQRLETAFRAEIPRLYDLDLRSNEAQTILNEMRQFAAEDQIALKHVGALIDSVRNYQMGEARTADSRAAYQRKYAREQRRIVGNEEPVGPPDLIEAPEDWFDASDPESWPPIQRVLSPAERDAMFSRMQPQELESAIAALETLRNNNIRGKVQLDAQERDALFADLDAAHEERKARVKRGEMGAKHQATRVDPEKVAERRKANQLLAERKARRVVNRDVAGMSEAQLSKLVADGERIETALADDKAYQGSPRQRERLAAMERWRAELAQRQTAAIDQAAHEAATSPQNDLPEPTEAMKSAGNYRKGHVKIHGLDISIENPKGSTRSGTDANGKPWQVVMEAHYGYVRQTESADGEQMDVYIGPQPDSDRVFVVDQVDTDTRQFDEHKVILGVTDLAEAQALYDAHFDDGKGPQRRGAVTEMSVAEFKEWLKSEDSTKPLAYQEPPPKRKKSAIARDAAQEAPEIVQPSAFSEAETGKPFQADVFRYGQSQRQGHTFYSEFPDGTYSSQGELEKVPVSLRNPLVVDGFIPQQTLLEQWEQQGDAQAGKLRAEMGKPGAGFEAADAYITQKAKALGHDGVVMRGDENQGGNEVMVFENAFPANDLPAMKVVKQRHTKKNKDIYIVTLASEVARDIFDTLRSEVESRGGWYSRAWGRSPRGFAFNTEAEAQAFVDDKTGKQGVAPKAEVVMPTPATKAAEPVAVKPESQPESQPVPQPEAETKQAKAFRQLADAIYVELSEGRKLDNRKLQQLADPLYGGSPMSGAYTLKDAYDATELAVNYWISERAKTLMRVEPATAFEQLRKLMGQLPTQRSDARTKEQQDLQQFSTPPQLAYLAAKVLAATENDLVLEPSAGTGSLAVFARGAGAEVHTNEISERRREALKRLGFSVSGADAEFLNSTLPSHVQPSAVLMNPPFSSTGDRGLTNSSKYGARHVEEALLRLQPGGRLVAIVSDGMGMDRPKLMDWWQKIASRYNVRADVSLSGEEYAKYGTTYDNRLLVIEKTGPTPGATYADQVENVLSGRFDRIEDAYEALRTIAEDRPAVKRAAETGTTANARPTQAEQPATESAPAMESGNKPAVRSTRDGAAAPGNRSGGAGDKRSGSDAAASGATRPGESAATVSGNQPGNAVTEGNQPVQRSSGSVANDESGRVDFGTNEALAERKEEAGGTFVEYVPAKVRGGGKHPAPIVEAASMAAIEPPTPTYQPNLPKETLEKRLSNVQLETVVYTGQRHEQKTPSGARAGYFIGDGTGVGKGRQISAIIYDNWRQGRRRAIWFSTGTQLQESAQRDLNGVGAKDIPLYLIHDYASGEPIDAGDGVMFATYSMLIGKSNDKEKLSRFAQIKEWLGDDPVIVFDECHKAKNAIGAQGEGTQTGQAVINLQRALPNARVVYASATGATDVRNMAYMDRLGMWGPGTAFPDGFEGFWREIEAGGVGAMEMVARDMKAVGAYASRSISYGVDPESGLGVEYSKHEHVLSEGQREIYDGAAAAWTEVSKRIEEAITQTNGGARQKSRAMSVYYSAQQRFFKALITAAKVPTAIEIAEKAIKDGKQVVLSLIGTGEAQQDRVVRAATASGADLEDMDFSPREVLYNYIDRSFPVEQYKEVRDAQGNKRLVPVEDEQGNPVLNAEAVRMREELKQKVSGLVLPESPLDQIINHFEAQKIGVAELTGRKKRLMRDPKTGKMTLQKRAPVPAKKINEYEMSQFQSGKKPVAVISQAAAEGISLHADKDAPTRGKRRVQITLELDWSADKQMQTFGRTHRTNQSMPPEFVLLSSNVGGEARFISTIARRLASLGALTKGQRDAAGAGSDFADFNFETPEGEAATGHTLQMLHGGNVPGAREGREILEEMGLLDKDKQVKQEALGDVTKFLNRVLAQPLDRQNAIFDYFAQSYQRIVEQRKASGMFDAGVTDLKAQRIERKGEPVEIHQDKRSGARTQAHTLELEYPTYVYRFNEAMQYFTANVGDGAKFARNRKTDKVALLMPSKNKTNAASGAVKQTFSVSYPDRWRDTYVDADQIENNWEVLHPTVARERWEKQADAAPTTTTDEAVIFAGALLPIWQHLKGDKETGELLRIVRVQLDNGERLVGVYMRPSKAKRVLRSLGLESQRRAPQEIFDAVRKGENVSLMNGLMLGKVRVRGEDAIQLLGVKRGQERTFRDLGLIEVKNFSNSQFFVPTDAEKGVEVLGRLLGTFPEMVEARQSGPAASRRAPGQFTLNDIQPVLSEAADYRARAEAFASTKEADRAFADAQARMGQIETELAELDADLRRGASKEYRQELREQRDELLREALPLRAEMRAAVRYFTFDQRKARQLEQRAELFEEIWHKAEEIDQRTTSAGRARAAAELAEREADFQRQTGKPFFSPAEQQRYLEDVTRPRNRQDFIKSEEFQDWFGKGKAVADDGQPQVLYARGDWEVFDLADADANGYVGRGLYLTSESDTAVGEGAVMPLYTNARKPFDIDRSTLTARDVAKLPADAREMVVGDGPVYYDDLLNGFGTSDKVNEWLRSVGYDALTFGTPKTWVVFESRNVKSATGNVGTYSGSEPNILMSRRNVPRLSELDNPLDSLKYATLNAKAATPGKPARFYTNEHGMAILATVASKIFKQNYIGTDGLTFTRQQITRLVAGLRQSRETVLRGLADTLDAAIAAHPDQKAFWLVDTTDLTAEGFERWEASARFKATAREERFHWAQVEIDGQGIALTGKTWAERNVPAKIKRKLIDAGYPDDPEILAAETAAKIAANKLQELGIRTDADVEAAQKWLAKYFERVVERHGEDALNKFGSLRPQADAARREAIERGRETRLAEERDSATRAEEERARRGNDGARAGGTGFQRGTERGERGPGAGESRIPETAAPGEVEAFEQRGIPKETLKGYQPNLGEPFQPEVRPETDTEFNRYRSVRGQQQSVPFPREERAESGDFSAGPMPKAQPPVAEDFQFKPAEELKWRQKVEARLEYLKTRHGLSEEEHAKLAQAAMEAVQKGTHAMAVGDEKEYKAQQRAVYKLLRDDLWTTVATLRKAGLLTGIKTHLRNLGGNAVFQVIEEAARVPGSMVDMVTSAVTKQRTFTRPELKAVAKAGYAAATEGVKKAINTLKHGAPDEQQAQQQLQELQSGSKIIDAYVNGVFRLLSAEDQIFRTFALQRAMHGRAKAQALTEVRRGELERGQVSERVKELLANPPEEMAAEALLDSEVATFNNDNWLSSAIQRGRNGLPRSANFAADMLLPFDRTPTNIIFRVLEYSPLGYGKAAVDLGRLAHSVAKKSFTAKDQQAFARTFGRATVGTGLISLGYILAQAGMMMGYRDDDSPADWKKLSTDRQKGRSPMSIYVPATNTWHQIGQFSPAGNLLAAGATLYHERLGVIGAMKTAGQVVEEQPLLESVKNARKLASDPAYAGGNIVSSFVPRFVQDVGQLEDNKARKAVGFKQQIQKAIPLVRKSLPEQPYEVRRTDFFDPTLTRTNRAPIAPEPQVKDKSEPKAPRRTSSAAKPLKLKPLVRQLRVQ